jgi:TRAP-type uncharacterized transport system fused permease subunit
LIMTGLVTRGNLPLILVLVFIAITCIILGMAVPTTPAYIMTAALGAPALAALGLKDLQGHMFIFYFSTLSMITPPVALAAYAGAQIAGANIMKTGFTAVRIATAAYIIPFMFVYGPALLLQGPVWEVAWATCTASVGVIFLAAAAEGWFLVKTGWPERFLLGAASLLLIHPGLRTDLIGFALAAVAIFIQWRRRESKRALESSSAA